MGERIRIVIVDDRPLEREGLATILGAEQDMEVVGQASNGGDCLDKARALRPHVVVVDLNIAYKDGLTVIRQIAVEQPETRCLVLTDLADDEQFHLTLRAGAHGFLLKDCDTHQIVDAIRAVCNGTSVLPVAMAQRILGYNRHSPGVETLTPRELEVLRLIAMGLQNKEIARRLEITVATVLSHVRSIFRKLQFGNRTEAALYATRYGLGRGSSENHKPF